MGIGGINKYIRKSLQNTASDVGLQSKRAFMTFIQSGDKENSVGETREYKMQRLTPTPTGPDATLI